MAVARMSHLRLVGLRSQENKIVDELTDSGLFEVRSTDTVPYELKSDESELFRELRLKQSRISFAIDFIKQRHEWMAATLQKNARDVKAGAQKIDYTLPAAKLATGKMLITHADFSDVRAKEYDLMGVCDALQAISFEIVECRTRKTELAARERMYEPFVAAPVRLSGLKRVGGIDISLYYNRTPAAVDDMLKELRCAFDVRTAGGMLYTVISRAEVTPELEKRMSAAGYERCTFDDDCTAAQMIEALHSESEDCDRRIFELTKKALAYEKHYGELRILYDVIELETERAEADEKFLKTDATFVLEGWLPEAIAVPVTEKISGKYPQTLIQLLAPEDRDAPPTLVQNNKFVQPYEDVTNMYMAPKYREIDPNPVMSVFYFLFFGIMVGDAVYGLILATIGLVLGYSKKFDTGVKRLLLLIGWGGVSALIWGIIFGGYLSIDFGAHDISLWFNPMNDPLMLLVLSIVLGCVQLLAGYIIQFIKLVKAGDTFGAICDAGPTILIFAALACFGLTFVLKEPPKALTVTAIVIAGVAVAVMIIFGGRKNKNVFGKIFGGFKGLYGLVNLLSDVLSYCRLFGLCLASCAIGLAFNTLGSIIFGIPVIGYPIGVVLLAGLHVFNMALGVLSAYVHDARLQFLEFYGKFYEGNGRLFAPMGKRTKHIRFA